MMRGTTRWAHRALLLCAATAAATLTIGCDDFGERQSLTDQASAAAMRSAGGTAEMDKAIEKLQGVAGGGGNSPSVIQGQHALGQVQLAKADAATRDRIQTEAIELAHRSMRNGSVQMLSTATVFVGTR